MQTLKGYKKFKRLSDWIIFEGYCLIRIKKYGDINNVEDRITFIEKTPRIQILKDQLHYGWNGDFATDKPKSDNFFISGNKGDCYTKEDRESCKWCDDMLTLLGWEEK